MVLVSWFTIPKKEGLTERQKKWVEKYGFRLSDITKYDSDEFELWSTPSSTIQKFSDVKW